MEAKKRKNAHPRLQPETFFPFLFFWRREKGKKKKKTVETGPEERDLTADVCVACVRACVFSLYALWFR